MPKGKPVNNHKGRNRHFTNPEELEAASKKEKNKGNDTGEESSAVNSEAGSETDSEDEYAKAKGVSGLIEIDNPNRVHRKGAEKVTIKNLDENPSGSSSARGVPMKSELTRREREELDIQRPKLNDQNRSDLARLAIIKQQRAEAAARKVAVKKNKDEKTKTAAK